jgi:hypothetical protein
MLVDGYAMNLLRIVAADDGDCLALPRVPQDGTLSRCAWITGLRKNSNLTRSPDSQWRIGLRDERNSTARIVGFPIVKQNRLLPAPSPNAEAARLTRFEPSAPGAHRGQPDLPRATKQDSIATAEVDYRARPSGEHRQICLPFSLRSSISRHRHDFTL